MTGCDHVAVCRGDTAQHSTPYVYMMRGARHETGPRGSIVPKDAAGQCGDPPNRGRIDQVG